MKVVLLLLLFSGVALAEEPESGFFRNSLRRVQAFVNGFIGDYESPPYTVVKTFAGFEERRYMGGLKWVCTKTVGEKNSDVTTSTQFWKLFRYIGGNNAMGQLIEMTVPVCTKHRNSSNGEQEERTMCFYLGKAHQTDPPNPEDPEVFIKTKPEFAVYTRQVGGYMNERKWNAEKDSLTGLVSAQNLLIQSDYFFTSGYDSPYKFFNRRNEVWLVKKTTSEED